MAPAHAARGGVRGGDAEKARSLADELRDEGATAWHLETTFEDLEETVALARDDGWCPDESPLAARLVLSPGL